MASSDDGHVVIDFGDDDTQGRAHPMIDSSLRLERIAEEAPILAMESSSSTSSSATALNADRLTTAVRSAPDAAYTVKALPVVVSLTGTANDPQGYASVTEVLAGAGASVFLSNAAATRHAVAQLSGGTR